MRGTEDAVWQREHYEGESWFAKVLQKRNLFQLVTAFASLLSYFLVRRVFFVFVVFHSRISVKVKRSILSLVAL